MLSRNEKYVGRYSLYFYFGIDFLYNMYYIIRMMCDVIELQNRNVLNYGLRKPANKKSSVF